MTAERRYVPAHTGPLLRSRRDEDDQLIDELFGPPDPAGPSVFDAALAVIGLALVSWGLAIGKAPLSWLGGVLLLLGLVLPLRSLARRAAGRRRRTPGLALEVSDPLVARLVAASDEIFHGNDGARMIAQPVTHLASCEVAGLLNGAPPSGPAQRAYISQRVELLETLVARIRNREGVFGDHLDTREAQALGLLELEAASRSSIDVLRELTRGNSSDA